MKRYIIYIKGLLLFAFVMFLYGFSSFRNQAHKIKDLNINFKNGDNLFITYETVDKLLIQKFDRLKSQPKENIFLKEVEETLLSNEMIAKAEVFLTVNGELDVVIKQKTPIARVNQGSEMYYIDSEGGKMPLSSNYSARVPIINGIYDAKISKELFQLVTLIYNDDFLKKQIISIKQTPKKEFFLQTRIGNQRIELGTLNKIDIKIKKLKAFYNKAIKDNTLGQYRKINLMYNKQVVATKN